MDYKNGKIYMVYPNVDDAEEGDVYIGSTTQLLAKRMVLHRSHYKKGNYLSSSILFKKYGVDNCKIELICEFPCENKMELNREEGRYIRERSCVNKVIAGRTLHEYREDNRDKQRQYSHQYKQDNKDKIKQYEETNKEKIKKQKKIYRKENQEKI
jgi:hypothetical protein